MSNSLCIFDWQIFAGDKLGVWRGEKKGYACGNGQHADKVRYNARKERLTITGRNFQGPCSLGHNIVVTLNEKKPGKFTGTLSRSDFRTLLRELMASEQMHRAAQMRRLDETDRK